jgi:hypothetical protein
LKLGLWMEWPTLHLHVSIPCATSTWGTDMLVYGQPYFHLVYPSVYLH